MRIVIKGGMRGESCEDVVYAIVYGMRVIIGPIRNTYNNVQGDPERDRPAVQGPRLTAPVKTQREPPAPINGSKIMYLC